MTASAAGAAARAGLVEAVASVLGESALRSDTTSGQREADDVPPPMPRGLDGNAA